MGQTVIGICLIRPAGFEVKDSGPLRVAEFDCHSCEAPSTLTDPRCRKCVLSRLRTEGEIDQVILIRAICKIYCSRDLSKLARVIATAEQLALDRTLYVAKEEKNCKKCVDGRIAVVMGTLDQITTNPHDIKPLDDVVADARKRLKGKCKTCTEGNFTKLVGSIKETLKGVGIIKRLSPTNYDDVFVARVRPFFVEGVWHPPPSKARLIESYELSGKRGKVKIYEQESSPVLFYELELPEVKSSCLMRRSGSKSRRLQVTRGLLIQRACIRSPRTGIILCSTCLGRRKVRCKRQSFGNWRASWRGGSSIACSSRWVTMTASPISTSQPRRNSSRSPWNMKGGESSRPEFI